MFDGIIPLCRKEMLACGATRPMSLGTAEGCWAKQGRVSTKLVLAYWIAFWCEYVRASERAWRTVKGIRVQEGRRGQVTGC